MRRAVSYGVQVWLPAVLWPLVPCALMAADDPVDSLLSESTRFTLRSVCACVCVCVRVLGSRTRCVDC